MKFCHCLNREREFTCEIPGVKLRFRVRSLKDIEIALAKARVVPEFRPLRDTELMIHMDICIAQTITEKTWEILRLSNAIDAKEAWPWAGTWYDQPAMFTRARSVIDNERAKIKALQARNPRS